LVAASVSHSLAGQFFPGQPLHRDLQLMREVMESALDEMDRKRERLTTVYSIPVLGPILNNAVHKNLNGKDNEGFAKYWSLSHLAGSLVDQGKWKGVLECYDQAQRVLTALARRTNELAQWEFGTIDRPGHYWVGVRHRQKGVTVNMDPWKSLSMGEDHVLVIWLTPDPTDGGAYNWAPRH
jgi:hypothetical protein